MSTKVVKQDESPDRVEGRTSLYNPLLQKPIALHPVGPGSYPSGYGGYTYIGPPPDFGGSYGKFEDTAGREQIGVKASRMFSLYDGSPTQLKNELSQDERQALLSQMDAAAEDYKCESCRSELTISVAKQINQVFCPHCGSEMSDAAEKVKTCVSKLGEQSMSTVEAKAKKSKSNVDIAKEAAKAPAPGEHSKDFKPVEVDPKDHADIKPEQIKPMEELAKDMVKAEAEKKARIERQEKIKASVKAFREKAAKAKALAAAKATKTAATKTIEAGLDVEKATKLRRELRIMAATEPTKFAEAKKNPKFAAICAEVEAKLVPKADRLKIRAELVALTAAEGEAAGEEVKKHLDFVAPEILMDEAPEENKAAAEAEEVLPVDPSLAAAPADACGADAAKANDEGGSVKKDMEEAAPAAEANAELPADPAAEETFSMQTELLSSLSTLKGEKIEMSLYGEESENPFWNVTIDGEPVGRVYLQDQNHDDIQSIRAAFTSEQYPGNFARAAQKGGVPELLKVVNARLFAHRLDDSQALERVRTKAAAEARAGYDAKMETLRKDFLNAVTVAMTAADKNYYKDEAGHALKGGLWTALVQAGLNEHAAVAAIDAGFESAGEYFEYIFAKAQELMDMQPGAREEISKHIMASGKIQIQVEDPGQQTLHNRLIQSSVNVIAMGGEVDGETRKQIRDGIKLGWS